MNTELSLQEKYAKDSICYGCGPSNPDGLHIKSYPVGDEVICNIEPEAKYHSFPGYLYGGLIGCLMDCHCNWAATYHMMNENKMDTTPCTVTAQYTVKFLRPTPMQTPLKLSARVLSAGPRKAEVHGELYANDELCAVCDAVYVAVKPGHPAYHRW